MNCWDCALRRDDDEYFLGLCTVFEKVGKKAQEIPPTRVDVGCKFFEAKNAS